MPAAEYIIGAQGSHKSYASVETLPGAAAEITGMSGDTHVHIGIQTFSAAGSLPFAADDTQAKRVVTGRTGSYTVEVKTQEGMVWEAYPDGVIDLAAYATGGADMNPIAVRVTPTVAGTGFQHYRLIATTHRS